MEKTGPQNEQEPSVDQQPKGNEANSSNSGENKERVAGGKEEVSSFNYTANEKEIGREANGAKEYWGENDIGGMTLNFLLDEIENGNLTEEEMNERKQNLISTIQLTMIGGGPRKFKRERTFTNIEELNPKSKKSSGPSEKDNDGLEQTADSKVGSLGLASELNDQIDYYFKVMKDNGPTSVSQKVRYFFGLGGEKADIFNKARSKFLEIDKYRRIWGKEEQGYSSDVSKVNELLTNVLYNTDLSDSEKQDMEKSTLKILTSMYFDRKFIDEKLLPDLRNKANLGSEIISEVVKEGKILELPDIKDIIKKYSDNDGSAIKKIYTNSDNYIEEAVSDILRMSHKLGETEIENSSKSGVSDSVQHSIELLGYDVKLDNENLEIFMKDNEDSIRIYASKKDTGRVYWQILKESAKTEKNDLSDFNLLETRVLLEGIKKNEIEQKLAFADIVRAYRSEAGKQARNESFGAQKKNNRNVSESEEGSNKELVTKLEEIAEEANRKTSALADRTRRNLQAAKKRAIFSAEDSTKIFLDQLAKRNGALRLWLLKLEEKRNNTAEQIINEKEKNLLLQAALNEIINGSNGQEAEREGDL